MRTALSLIVIPRSRSRSMVSRSCSRMCRFATVAVCLDQAIGEGGLAMVDVGDDAEVPDGRLGHDAENIVEDPYPDPVPMPADEGDPGPGHRRPRGARGRRGAPAGSRARARCSSGSRPSASTSSRSTSAPVSTRCPSRPTPGTEAAGVVEAVGDGVDGFAAGDRVASTECHRGLRGVRPGGGRAGWCACRTGSAPARPRRCCCRA